MPSPVGHILAGTVVYLAAAGREHRSRVTLTATLMASIFPDFDFLPGILIGEPAAFHHGVSHSLMFAALFSALIFLFASRFQDKKTAARTAILGILAYVFHIVLDAVSVNEGARGVSILWPLSDHQFGLNLHILGHFHHGGIQEGIWSVVRWDNLPALAREFTALGIPVLLIFLWRERRDSRGQNEVRSM